MGRVQQVINNALRANSGMSLRAEDIEHYSQLFVDTVNLESLINNSKQLVLGRRGSGKTMLLGRVHESINSRFEGGQANCLSVFLTATHFKASPEGIRNSSPIKERSAAYFRTFLELLTKDLFDVADNVLKSTSLLSRLGMRSNNTARERFEECVLELLEIAYRGVLFESPEAYSYKVVKKRSKINEAMQSGEVSAEVRLSMQKAPNISGSAKGAKGQSMHTREEGAEVGSATLHRYMQPRAIREHLIELVTLLKLDYLVIIIDEWGALNEAQAEFAELLKRCLFGESKIAVKIGADPHQSRFNNGRAKHHFRGLEVGADIFEAVNFDIALHDAATHYNNFGKMLYKRLAFFSPPLREFFLDKPLDDPLSFTQYIFETPQAFLELCNGVQGFPRDLLSVFKDITKGIDWDISKNQLDVRRVRRGLMSQARNLEANLSDGTQSEKLFWQTIKPQVLRGNSIFFLIPQRGPEAIDAIEDLLSKRLIHAVPQDDLQPSLRGEYHCYEVDYGSYLNWREDFKFMREIPPMKELKEKLEEITLATAAKYTLNLDQIQKRARSKLCMSCDGEFSASAPSYKLKKLCPICFEPVE